MPLSTRDSTHYRMCAPHAIFDVAVGRVQMKLLLPRGVDLAWETLEASCQSELSSYLRPSPLPLSIFHPNVIITFNECYLLFEINKTSYHLFSCYFSSIFFTLPLMLWNEWKENISREMYALPRYSSCTGGLFV